jgi:MFS family permease
MIGLLGSMVFAGWMFGSLFIPRLGDLYGRKWPVVITLLVASLTYICVILSYNLKLTIGLMFLFGTCCAGRYSTSYVYLSELMPLSNRTLACSATQFIDASTLILLTLYFRFMSKEWLHFQIFGASMTLLCFFACLFIPESPDYLYSKGRYEEARKLLIRIGGINRRFNGREVLSEWKFDKELNEVMHISSQP